MFGPENNVPFGAGRAEVDVHIDVFDDCWWHSYDFTEFVKLRPEH